MKPQQTATARPWHTVTDSEIGEDGTKVMADEKFGNVVAQCATSKPFAECRANAALIVKAVNEHAALEALAKDAEQARIALTFFRKWVKQLTQGKESYPFGFDVESSLLKSLSTLEQIRNGKAQS